MPSLASCLAIAIPLLGLLGTIFGMIKTFDVLGAQGMGAGAGAVTGGIGEALVARLRANSASWYGMMLAHLGIAVFIVGVTLVSLDLAVRPFRHRPLMAADMLLAARAGLALLVVSCLLGIWVGIHGEMQQRIGLEPTRLGAAGVPKFPHGVAIHAIQWLPAIAWVARRAGIDEGMRCRLVASATAGTLLVAVYAVLQTALGRARFDTTPLTAAVLAAGVAGLAMPVAVTAWAMVAGRRQAR